MGQARTYGFGRVSPTVTPSPYSPLHRPSEIPGSSPVARQPPRAKSRSRWLVVVVVAAVVIASVTGIVAMLGRSAPPVAAKLAPSPPATAPLVDDEALRLPRSAIAVHRNSPRPKS